MWGREEASKSLPEMNNIFLCGSVGHNPFRRDTSSFRAVQCLRTYVWIYVCGNAIGPRGEANPSSASLGTTFTSIIIIYTNPTARQTGRADRYAHATCTDGPIPLRLRDSGGWCPFRQIRELRCDWLKLATRDTDWILKRNWKAQWFDIDFPPPSTHFNGLLW